VEDVVGCEGIAGMIIEYPVSLRLEPGHTPHKRDDAGQQK
jgi:hypothetical protein